MSTPLEDGIIAERGTPSAAHSSAISAEMHAKWRFRIASRDAGSPPLVRTFPALRRRIRNSRAEPDRTFQEITNQSGRDRFPQGLMGVHDVERFTGTYQSRRQPPDERKPEGRAQPRCSYHPAHYEPAASGPCVESLHRGQIFELSGETPSRYDHGRASEWAWSQGPAVPHRFPSARTG